MLYLVIVDVACKKIFLLLKKKQVAHGMTALTLFSDYM